MDWFCFENQLAEKLNLEQIVEELCGTQASQSGVKTDECHK